MSDIEILVDAIDNASAKLDALTAKLGGVNAANDANTQTVNRATTANSGLERGLVSMAARYLSVYAIIRTVTGAVKESISAAAEAEAVDSKLAWTLQTTGRGAEIGAGQIDTFAVALMKATGIDDEAIKNAYDAIAAFDNVPTDKLDEIVTLAADMSTKFGDLASNAASVAGVLETGVIPRSWRFSAALKTNIQDLIKAGDTTGALTLMLDELNQRFGGQAVNVMNTYTGKINAAKTAWAEYLEVVGKAITQNQDIINLIGWFTNSMEKATTELDTFNRAQAVGLEATRGVSQGQIWLNGHLITYIELLKLVEAEEERLRNDRDERNWALNTGIPTLPVLPSLVPEDYTAQLAFITTYSKTYTDFATKRNELDKAWATAWAQGYRSLREGTMLGGLTQQYLDLAAAEKDATDTMVLGFADAAAKVDDISTAINEAFVDEGEYEFIIGLSEALGKMTDAEAAAALKAWEVKAQIEEIMKLPPEKRMEFILEVKAQGLDMALLMQQLGMPATGGFAPGFYMPAIPVGATITLDPSLVKGSTEYWVALYDAIKQSYADAGLDFPVPITPDASAAIVAVADGLDASATAIAALDTGKLDQFTFDINSLVASPKDLHFTVSYDVFYNYVTSGTPIEGQAGGGFTSSGGWAMVGDAPGGGRTPYTEYVHARPGGGFDVYNQSQMAGRSAPPMASGGVIPGGGGEFHFHLHYNPFLSTVDEYEIQNRLEPAFDTFLKKAGLKQ